MNIIYKTYWLPKAGNKKSEYEDRFWPATKNEQAISRFAIADGATETSFSKLWAQILVRAYGKNEIVDFSPEALIPLQMEWWNSVNNKELPWYAYEKMQMGAYASFLGLDFQNVEHSQTGTWRSLAVGDCCLFQIREKQLINCFPIERSDHFSSRPVLIPSIQNNNHEYSILRKNGPWMVGDTFYLMSDAIANWFLTQWERKADPLELIDNIFFNSEFNSFIANLRKDRDESTKCPLLKNDDVTLCRCKMVNEL